MAALGNPEVSAIRLAGNISLNSALTVNHDVTIDLNDYRITGSTNGSLFVADGAKLTLKGHGNVTNNGQVGAAKNGGEIVIEDGTYRSARMACFRAMPAGNITVNGGNLTGQEGAIDCYGKGANDVCGATVTVNGGHLEGIDNSVIATNGSAGMGGNRIVVNGGTLIGNISTQGYEAIGIYIPNNDTLEINNGEITANGGTGICMRAGHVSIHGGRITATGVSKTGTPVADGKIGDYDMVVSGVSAIVYHESANYPGKAGMELNIDGGIITGVDHSIQILSNEANPNVHVNGGSLIPAWPEAS